MAFKIQGQLMKSLNLLHISDLHFSAHKPSLEPDEALCLMGETVYEEHGQKPLVLAISGDVTTHGNVDGFHEAADSIQEHLIKRLNIKRTVLCPGNHDIVNGDRLFADFNKFALQITKRSYQSWNPNRCVVIEEVDGYTFLLVNSSFHGDHSFGRVPLQQLEKSLIENRGKKSIILIHHSPISSDYGGEGLAASYELLALASRERVLAVLHGHVHSDQLLEIGRLPTLVTGVGSLAFSPDPNMNNQFSFYSFQDGRPTTAATYRYQANRKKFIPMELL